MNAMLAYEKVRRNSNRRKELKSLIFEFELQTIGYLATPFSLLAFSRSSVGANFVSYASNIECFQRGGCLFVPSSYNIPVSIYMSSCGGFVGKAKEIESKISI